MVLISVTLIPVVIIVLLGNFYLQSFEVRSQAVQTSFEAQNNATREQINLQRMNALLQARFAQIFAQNSVALGGDPSLAASGGLIGSDITNLELDFNDNLTLYQQNFEISTSDNMKIIRGILSSDAPNSTVESTQHIALSQVMSSDWTTYRHAQDTVLTDLDANKGYKTSYADFYQANLDFLTLKNHWQQVVDAATIMGTTVTQVGPSLINPLIFYTTSAVLFTLLVIALAGLLVSSTIVIPLNRLVGLTRRIAQGDTKARAEIEGNDEIHQVATSMNSMLDVTVQLMQEAQYRHMNLQSQIENLIHEVSGIGEGDLRIHANVIENELGALAHSFNLTAGQLNNLVVNVKMLARGVQNATLQTFGYVEQLVDNADLQMRQIAEATAEVDNMARSSRQVAERTRVLSNVAGEARQVAQVGRGAVQQTVDGMAHINSNIHFTTEKVLLLGERSREIHDIVEVMSNIAQQTNRLALDAAIQAAMAGDQGAGFGTVAVDIRRLAERAKEQTARIIKLVNSVLDDINTAAFSIQETENEVESGAILAKEVGNAFESIFSVVERQAGEIEVTNRVALQQLQSTKKVEQIMRQVADATQQSSNSTNQATQQMRTLAQIAGQLLASVDVFKLKEDRRTNVPFSEGGFASPQTQEGFNAPRQMNSNWSMNERYALPPANDRGGRSGANTSSPYQGRPGIGVGGPPELQK
ncbi:MAG: hypothetical protein PVS3B1_22850 [Ktedonobacteraceae bacterium]